MTYTNPVISGFYPDPSMCRVGEDYYLVTSSFEYFPGVPIFHSRDLVNWRQIGHCLTRPEQLRLTGASGGSAGIYAATLRYHHGRFYMVTTNASDRWNFYVFTDDITGEWSDPIWVDQGGIDPSLLFDEDGSVYFTTNGNNKQDYPLGIYQSAIDIETGQRLTPIRALWSGTGGKWPEAPHLYHLGEWYFLMLAEGGTGYEHMVTIARSKDPWGPFDACPRNPILTHRDLAREPIQGTGHADLLQAHDGSWWLTFLAFQPHNGLFHHLGRETYLAPVTWDDDGWPVVNQDQPIQFTMPSATLSQHPWPAREPLDNFDAAELDLHWNFLRTPHIGDWSLSERPGWLRLHGSAVTLNDLDSPAFVGRRQRYFNCRVSTLLDFVPQRPGEEAGLVVLANESHHYEIAVIQQEGARQIVARRRIGDLVAIVAQKRLASNEPLHLIIEADKDNYTFAYALPDEGPRILATGATRYLTTEVAGGFTGVYLGMYATGTGQPCSVPADFDWFFYEVEPLASTTGQTTHCVSENLR